MANIPGEIVWQANDNTWFTNNAAEVYPAGITIYHVDGRYKFTDGVTTLGALPFMGDSSSTGVQSVTGSNVDNTDPTNPIVNTPTLTEVIAEDTNTNNLLAQSTLNRAASTSTLVTYSHRFNFFGSISGTLLSNSVSQLYNLFKGTFDTVYTTTSAVATQITTALSGYLTSAAAASTYKKLQVIASVTQTSVNDINYIVNVSSIFTDPAPEEGKGYTVLVINGTATVGGVNYGVAGTEIQRIYHSGSWVTYTNILTNTFFDYSPTYTGVSAAPSGGVNRYCLQDKLCTVYVAPISNGTSNATSFTITLPFNAKNLQVVSLGFCVDNGAITGGGYGITSAGSNVLTLAKQASGTWTSTPTGKRAVFTIQYEIQ